jgi:hypothetical protein
MLLSQLEGAATGSPVRGPIVQSSQHCRGGESAHRIFGALTMTTTPKISIPLTDEPDGVVDYRLECLERGHINHDRASPARPASRPIATSLSRST